MIKKILIANRGEIALRIVRAARDLGIKSVAAYSDSDAESLAVRLADESISLGGNSSKDTYLNIQKLILAAVQSGADAVHPGYGFLSENEAFAKAVEDQGLTFIGPSSDVLSKMGDKLSAREIAIKAGVPVLSGQLYSGDLIAAKNFAKEIGYPILVKASAGGSGRGIRLSVSEESLAQMIQEAENEALSAFSSKVVYLEKYLPTPRHIEVQILGDASGEVMHLFDRDCSVQRRRQKLIEEAPAVGINPELRGKILNASVELAKSVAYKTVGTLEFLVDSVEDKFYFLEMNTRIQVEHPVTEEVTGVDLVATQIKLAEGALLKDLKIEQCIKSHSIEFRIYSEDPTNNFAPVTGTIKRINFPSGPGIRLDTWVEEGTSISPYYDALIAKLIVSAPSRELAINRAQRAFKEFLIEGITTNLNFYRALIETPEYSKGGLHIKWLEESYCISEQATNFTFRL